MSPVKTDSPKQYLTHKSSLSLNIFVINFESAYMKSLEITDIEYEEHTEYFRLQDWAFLWLAKPFTQMILSHLLKHSLGEW